MRSSLRSMTFTVSLYICNYRKEFDYSYKEISLHVIKCEQWETPLHIWIVNVNHKLPCMQRGQYWSQQLHCEGLTFMDFTPGVKPFISILYQGQWRLCQCYIDILIVGIFMDINNLMATYLKCYRGHGHSCELPVICLHYNVQFQ